MSDPAMTDDVMERVARALFAIDPADPWKGLTTVSWAGKLAMASDFLERLNAAGLAVYDRNALLAALVDDSERGQPFSQGSRKRVAKHFSALLAAEERYGRLETRCQEQAVKDGNEITSLKGLLSAAEAEVKHCRSLMALGHKEECTYLAQLSDQHLSHEMRLREAAEAEVKRLREALEVPKVWTELERDGMTNTFLTASKKHGMSESLFAVAAWLLRHRAALTATKGEGNGC